MDYYNKIIITTLYSFMDVTVVNHVLKSIVDRYQSLHSVKIITRYITKLYSVRR